MPEYNYDHEPQLHYLFPQPVVDFSTGISLVQPPRLVKAVGVDGRDAGWLRRFPGFKSAMRDEFQVDLNSASRVWYASIQKGFTDQALRGFVIQDVSPSDANETRLTFDYYDTELDSWNRRELLNTQGSPIFRGVENRGYIGTWPQEVITLQGIAWDRTRGRLVGLAYLDDESDNPGVVEANPWMVEINESNGHILRKLGDAALAIGSCQGLAYHHNEDAFFTLSGNVLTKISADLFEVTAIGTVTEVGAFADLAYIKSTNKLWMATYPIGPGSTTFYDIDITDGSAAAGITLSDVQFSAICEDQIRDGDLIYIHGDVNNDDLLEFRSVEPAAGGDELTYLDNPYTGLLAKAVGLLRLESHPSELGQTTLWCVASHPSDPLAERKWMHILLDVFDLVGSHPIDVDVTSDNRYIYVSMIRGKHRVPMNLAFWWDVDQTATGDIVRRRAGALHEAHWSRAAEGLLEAGPADDGDRVTYAHRYYSRRHGVFSPISQPQVFENRTALGSRAWRHSLGHYENERNVFGALPIDDPDAVIQTFRSINFDTSSLPTLGDDLSAYGLLYPEQFPAHVYEPTEAGDNYVAFGQRTQDYPKTDQELSIRVPYDPITDFVGLMPRTTRILATDDQLYIVASPFSLNDPSTDFDETAQRAVHRLMWSPPEKFEPENFRGPITGEQYRFPYAATRVLSLERVGEFVFAVCNDIIVRAYKSGPYVLVNPLQTSWGGVSRDGSAKVGQSLFVVTRLGLKQVDSNSMQEISVGVVRRLLTTREYWLADLTNVEVQHDAALGALVLLNKTLEEMCLLWFETGAVTTLEDCAFVNGCQGPDPNNDNGTTQSFWLDKYGRVWTPNGDETTDKLTMRGHGSTEPVNGTATGGSVSSLVDTDVTFAAADKGLYVHMLSGSNIGLKRRVATASGSNLTFETAFPNAVADGDRYALGPIPFRVKGWHVGATVGSDMFRRKIVSGMNAAVLLDGGETDPELNPNLQMTYNLYKRDESSTLSSNTIAINEDPTKMAAAVRGAGPLLFPEWVQLASNVDFRLLGGFVSGKMTKSRADSSP